MQNQIVSLFCVGHHHIRIHGIFHYKIVASTVSSAFGKSMQLLQQSVFELTSAPSCWFWCCYRCCSCCCRWLAWLGSLRFGDEGLPHPALGWFPMGTPQKKRRFDQSVGFYNPFTFGHEERLGWTKSFCGGIMGL